MEYCIARVHVSNYILDNVRNRARRKKKKKVRIIHTETLNRRRGEERREVADARTVFQERKAYPGRGTRLENNELARQTVET